jgi:hypothetical protein
VLIVEVDVLNAKPLEAPFAGLPDILRPTVDAADVGIARVAHNAEFRCDQDFLTTAPNGFAHQLFVFVRTIDVCGVEKISAQFKSPIDGGQRFRVVATTVEFRHAHATETKR